MVKKLFVILFIGCSMVAWAQRPGSLRGVVTDARTKEAIPFANIVIKDNAGNNIKGGVADVEGRYNINPVTPGTYNIEFSSLNYATTTVRGIVITPNDATVYNMALKDESALLDEVTIIWEKPLIDKKTVVTQEEITQMAVRDVGAIAAQTAGALQQEEGGGINIRGGREDATTFFIDGVKVRGAVSLPQAAIAQQQVYTGGLPAQFGDAIGGVINTTTRGPSPSYFGSAEILTSSPFDQYHFNVGALTVGGPIYKNKKKEPIVGFLFAGEFEFQNDPRPFAVPNIRINEDKLNAMRDVPVRPSTQGAGILYETEFITADDFETIPARLNAQRTEIRTQTNINIKTGRLSNLALGGRVSYRRGMNPSFFHSMFNYDNFGEFINSDWAVLARFQQSLGNDSSSSSKIKNVFYQIQFDYSRGNRLTQDPRHQDNVFRYGHIGRFDRFSTTLYAFGQDSATGLQGWRGIVPFDTAIVFTPGPHNPVRARYTQFYYDAIAANPFLGSARTFDDLRLGRALWNGDNPPGVYSNLWGNIGANTTDYNKSMQSQWRFTGSVNFDIGGHSIIAGFEVEQRIDRGFAVGANNLWTLMFQLQNDHVLELDLANPIPVFKDGVFQDTINYNRKFDGDKLSAFSERFRRSQGLDPQGVDFLNVFGYEPEDFELGFFSADELINLSGSRLVNYFGYDHTGQLSDRRVSINDFFEARGADGRRLRPIGAFEPIYAAFFIQDQFTFDDLRFNVGVRVDRYDANQPVLRDPYNLYPGANAGELRGGFGGGRILGDVPNNIGDDASIYVDNYNYFLDGTETSRIVGFRQGDDFFDALGRRLDDPNELQRQGGGVVRPVLFDSPDNVRLNAESFRDYTPQIVVMPRISFDFPISDEALFYAHYDVLAQRPDVGLSRFNPINMLELEFGKNLNQPIGNPDLLPQRTTDYELGFQQILTERSSLKIAGFYREMRDMMQTIALTAAYPNTYITYGNRDFGTVKGFSFEYDLRRTNNISINANYTLQFADGTGSGPNTSLNLARTNQPNLRYILPLSFDSRHQLLLRVDYRYGKGNNYNGPVWWNKRVFENTGINFVVTGNSGTPYSRRQFAYAITQAATSVPLTGQINGSRLPWQVRVDSRINKRFDFAFKKGGAPKNGLDVYIQVLNLFNTLNVSNVYAYTGAPDDDGFLTSPQSINFVNSAVSSQSYIDLYQAAMLNPFNFGLPRRIRLGIVLDF